MARQERLLVGELQFHERSRERFLLEHDDRHLLMKGRWQIGSFAIEDQAVGEGVRQFGAGPFPIGQAGGDTPAESIPSLSPGLSCRS